MKLLWTGNIALTTGTGVFLGTVGTNTPHAHTAHQISLSRSGNPLKVTSDRKICSSDGVFIASGVEHVLEGDDVLSVYIDPASVVAEHLLRLHSLAGVKSLSVELMLQMASLFNHSSDLGKALQSFTQSFGAAGVYWRNARLSKILTLLEEDISTPEMTPVSEIAKQLSLSESRFSHWFKEQTGLPFKRYRQWLRLLRGIECLLNCDGISDAALQAQFSDQAHFSRVLKLTFGVTPGDLVKAVQWESRD